MNWKQADIPLLASPQGGVAERSGKYCEASADREARVVFRMNPMETTPAASASVASRNFFDDAATPPCGDARRGMAPHPLQWPFSTFCAKPRGSRTMKYLRLIFRYVVRNRRRTILTVLSITMSLSLISTLKTLLDELENPPATPESARRLFTRHKVSLSVMMPLAYREKIRSVPGVEDIT